MIISKLFRCVIAGFWFAVASVIPVAYYFMRFGDALPIFGGSSVLTAAGPIILAGICGLLLGSTILDFDETKSASQAAVRGLFVGLLTYLLLFTLPLIIFAFISTDLVNDFIGFILLFAITFVYGLFIVGWMIAVVGAIAGWLLYLLRLKFSENRTLE